MAIFLKILGILGLTTAGTGLGVGMESSGSAIWQIALAVVGLGMGWLMTSQFATNYRKMKAVLHEVSDMLEDDKITLQEVKDIIQAWKTGIYQPD